VPATHTIIADDIRGVLSRTRPLWTDLEQATVFITGATGFFGIWLLETLLAANREMLLGMRVVALSRNPTGFAAKAPELANDPAVTWVLGDVRDFPFPAGPVTHVIHAATESTSNQNASDPQAMFDVCVEGTRRVLALVREKRVGRMLFTSSGAVYGRQPPELTHVAEDFRGGPDPLDRRNAYAEGKRAAEFLCGLAATDPVAPVPVSIARCFAFVGPHLPHDVHFAVGNFLRDALAGGPIRIAEVSGQAATLGIVPLINLMALLSISLALLNLFPIPLLDGGHLAFYAAEAIRGRPLPARAQEYGFRVGFALLISLFVFVTFNDIVHGSLGRWIGGLLG
jgi:dTDP-glucose 4,6-dehydratase